MLLQTLPSWLRRLLAGGIAALIALMMIGFAPNLTLADGPDVDDKTAPVYRPGASFLLWNYVQGIEDPNQALEWKAKEGLTLESVQFVQGRVQLNQPVNGRYNAGQSFFVNIYNTPPPPPAPIIEPAGLFFSGYSQGGIILIVNDARFVFGRDLKITAFYQTARGRFYQTGFIRYSGIPKN